MPITAQYAPISSTSAGDSAPIPVTWPFAAPTDLVVYERTTATGVETEETYGVDYTVTWTPTGGTVTPLRVRPVGTRWIVERSTDITQPSSLKNGGPYNPETVENVLNRSTLQIQELREEVPAFPEKRNRTAGAPLVFNDSGGVSAGSAELTGDMLLRGNLIAASGAALVGFSQARASAVVRDLSARGRDTLHAADYGVVADGATNNSTFLANVIADAAARGGADILLPYGVVRFSTPLVISSSGVRLVGASAYMAHDGGAGAAPGTMLHYVGPAGVDAITFTSPAGASSQKRHSGGLRNVWIDGNATAARGLVVTSVNLCKFEDVYVQSCTAHGIAVGVISGSLAEAKDAQRNIFERCYVEATGSANCWHLYGDATANASFNNFINCGGRHTDGHAWFMENSDNNLFHSCSAFRASGAGYTVFLSGANAGQAPARSNHFVLLSGNGGVISKGTASFTQPAVANTITAYDKDNGSPDPVIEAGSQLSWATDSGLRHGEAGVKVAIAETAASAGSARSAIGTESVRIANASENHVRLVSGAGEWSISIDGSGNLRLLRVAGTGVINLGAGVSDIKIDGNVGLYGSDPGAKPNITGSRGGNAALASLLTQGATVGYWTDSTSA